jgi:vitamin B12 transporter
MIFILPYFPLFQRGIMGVSVVFFLPLIFSYSAAQPSDSVKKKFPPIEVTAVRIPENSLKKFSAYSNITKSDISEIGAKQISEILSLAPGVYLKDYGGLGGLKTISLRGTTSEQTLILLDGMKLNSSQNGLLDLSTMPVSIFENIEIVRGGASSIYGGNAIGGVINLNTNNYDINSSLKANLSYGSFGEMSGSLNGIYVNDKFRLNGYLEYLYSQGDYPFHFQQFGENKELLRENADFSNISFGLSALTEYKNWEIKPRVMFRASERGTPGAVVQGDVESARSRLNENETIIMLQSLKQFSPEMSINIGLSGRFDDLNYKDPDAILFNPNGLNEFYSTRDFQLLSKFTMIFGEFFTDWIFEMGYSTFNLDYYRNTYALSQRTERKFEIDSICSLSFQLGLRLDALSDRGNALSPMAGFALKLNDIPFNINLNWSYNFRPPNFNELYYPNFGNPNLKSERASSLNLGITYQLFDNLIFELDGFIITTNNQIISVPKSPISGYALNIGKVLTKGFEFSLKNTSSIGNIKTNLLINYTLQSATDVSSETLTFENQVPYIPKEMFNLFGSLGWKDFTLGINGNYSSYRFSVSDNSVNSLMPSYYIINLFMSQTIMISNNKLTIRFNCNNLFNESYYIIKNYPMPGRSFRIRFSSEL